jgi:hypothetical protein
MHYSENEKTLKWFNSLESNFEKESGKSVQAWLDIMLTCPETTQRKQLAWLKKHYGILQNRGLMILSYAENNGIPILSEDPEALVAALFSKSQHLLPIYDAVTSYVGTLESAHMSPRKTYITLSRTKQFGILMPHKHGLIVGFTFKPVPNHDRILLTGKKVLGSDRITAYVILNTIDDFDGEVKSLLMTAHSAN